MERIVASRDFEPQPLWEAVMRISAKATTVEAPR